MLICCLGQTQSWQKIHHKATVVDTHNDVLSSLDGRDISHRLTTGHSDLVRWKEGGLNVQFFSVWTGPESKHKEGPFKDANVEIDSLEFIILRNLPHMALATTYKQVKRGIRQNKLVALIGVEGGHMIEGDMEKFNTLYRRGMRYMTLTWNNSTSWSTSAMDETLHADTLSHKGLTEFGREIVRTMNRLGVIVDLSHTGERTFYDALATTSKPVILSHSSVWSICPVFRNVKDDQIKAIAANKGVICINFYSGFIDSFFAKRYEYLNGPGMRIVQDSLFTLSKDSAKMKAAWKTYYDQELAKVNPTMNDVVNHIDHIAKLVGVDYVGIGSDFDGVDALPAGLEDVTTYPKITQELLRRGYSKRSVKKILGGNVMRVMKANLR